MIDVPAQTRHLMEIAKRPPLIMVEGRGSTLLDAEGRSYLDFVQGWAVNCLGHSPAVVVEAISAQAGRLINPSPSFFNARSADLATRLAENSFADRVFFANSGAEANEGAIKLARKWGAKYKKGAYEIITTTGGFHGRTLATMSASGKAQWQDLYEPKVPGFIKVPFDDPAAVEAAITDRTVAVMLEPIQGEGGVYPASAKTLRALRELTRRRDLLLILDEIQTGMGRTGTLFAYEQAGIEPDVMTLGKGLGGGLPIAALLAREEICCFEPGDQGGTFNGNPLVAAAACAVLGELLKPGFLATVAETGRYFQTELERLSARNHHEGVRGLGLLLGLALRKDVSGASLVQQGLSAGLIINSPRGDTLRFMPALNVTKTEIDRCLEILEALPGFSV